MGRILQIGARFETPPPAPVQDGSSIMAEACAAGPKVTVLMPVYNGQRYLDEAIASVLAQDFGDFEFLIVDDGSTDATAEILRGWAERDRRIVLHRLDANGGVARALNCGLSRARGPYICRQDADDVCVPGRVSRQVAALDRDSRVVLVSAGYDLIDAAGRRLGRRKGVFAPEVTAHLLHFNNAVGGHGQVMFRRDVVLGLGGYREEFNLSEDYDLWARLSRQGRIVTLPFIGMKHRVHAESVSVRFWQEQQLQSRRVSAWMVADLLGEELSAEEGHAFGALWKAAGDPEPPSRAEAIMRKAYARFKGGGASLRHRRSVRYEMARIWLHSGLNHAARRRIARAAVHAGYAVSWHPGILLGGAVHVARVLGLKLLARRQEPAVTATVRGPGTGSRVIDPSPEAEPGPHSPNT